MSKLPLASVLWLIFTCASVWAQGAPPLDTFTSPDGAFQFVYPETYELLVGERLLNGTQCRHSAIPVCNFSTALACVVYPIEVQDESHLEAAGFSVTAVPSASSEDDCLTYTDQIARSRGERSQPTSITINDQVFRHTVAKKNLPGHQQAADLYRTYLKQTCYELQINVSLSDDSAAGKPVRANSAGNASANTAREALGLILSSFVFR
jgi:hypothetical protein